ncbi:MAG: ABC transporter ATP-binding protein [Synergistaceae bacterium]|jgi:iron complex transport system ATP-binding protein|nr:ABC transporter ATP-binding protein [Synergistaceae bacterium]
MLEVKSLSLSVGGAAILRDVSVTVGDGEFVAVVGPNGAGKSSLLKCVNRVYRRYGGDILLDSVSTRRMPQRALARRVAYVPQFAAGAFSGSGFTVRQFVAQGRYPWRSWRDMWSSDANNDGAVDEAINLTGLTGLSDRLLDSLSGGERQKVMFAAAIAQMPNSSPQQRVAGSPSSILLLDEPTTYLDYRRQVEIAALTRSMRLNTDTSALIVTHDLNFALRSSDRVAVMSEGRVIWNGEPGELVELGMPEQLFGVKFARFSSGGGLPFIVPEEF